MEQKWPFMLIVVLLIAGLGLVMASLERTTVMQNWTARRCQLPVMVAARFFKPDTDPRSPSDFASDNFSFCVKSFVDRFMETLMAPIAAVMGKQANVTGGTLNVLQVVRKLAQTMYNAFAGYLASFFKRFHTSVFQLQRVIIHLRMAVQRMSAIAMSMIYAGITLFRTMINSIQAVIRVVLIISSIMLAIIILLFFVLFPFIPLIMSTLTAVVAIVVAFSAVMSQSIAGDAESKKSGFCFTGDTPVKMSDGTVRAAKDVSVGDELAEGCGTVTATMEMAGDEVELYTIEGHGIHVTPSHLIKGSDGQWKSVSEDERCVRSATVASRVYCFNTTTQTLPIASATHPTTTWFLFRDWEELDASDTEGHRLWNEMILTGLNRDSGSGRSTQAWKKDLSQSSEVPLMSGAYYLVMGNGDVRRICELRVGDWLQDGEGLPTRVTGIVKGLAEDVDPSHPTWSTETYAWSVADGCWRYAPRIGKGTETAIGWYVITESGTFRRIQNDIVVTHRDFTEIGADHIHETYAFVASRLR